MTARPGATTNLAILVGALPDDLEYTGEFGAELVLFLPFCGWLSRLGLLKPRRIITYRGMRCFYDGLDCRAIVEKGGNREWVRPALRPSWLPVKDEHSFDGHGHSALLLYPDLRAQFAALPLAPAIGTPQRPLLIIHNKHTIEWRERPINHISLATLEILFRSLQTEFSVVYVRHGMGAEDPGYADDHLPTAPFDDRALLDRYPAVLAFDDLYARHRAEGGSQDINTFKCVLYSRCHRFISAQGGGAHQIAMFSGSLLVVLHRRGDEDRWAYGDGYYGFMAPVPPIRAICRNEDDLLRALPLFAHSVLAEDRLLLAAGSERLLASLSPWTIALRR